MLISATLRYDHRFEIYDHDVGPDKCITNHPGVLELLAPAPLEGSRDKKPMSCGKTSSLLMVSTLMLYSLEYLSHCISIKKNWTQLLISVFRHFRPWHCWFVCYTVELVMVCASICMISSLFVIPGCDCTYRFLYLYLLHFTFYLLILVTDWWVVTEFLGFLHRSGCFAMWIDMYEI